MKLFLVTNEVFRRPIGFCCDDFFNDGAAMFTVRRERWTRERIRSDEIRRWRDRSLNESANCQRSTSPSDAPSSHDEREAQRTGRSKERSTEGNRNELVRNDFLSILPID